MMNSGFLYLENQDKIIVIIGPTQNLHFFFLLDLLSPTREKASNPSSWWRAKKETLTVTKDKHKQVSSAFNWF